MKPVYAVIFLAMKWHLQWPELIDAPVPWKNFIHQRGLATCVIYIKQRVFMELLSGKRYLGRSGLTSISFSSRIETFHMLITYYFSLGAPKTLFFNQNRWHNYLHRNSKQRYPREVVLECNVPDLCSEFYTAYACTNEFLKEFLDNTVHDESHLYVKLRPQFLNSGSVTELCI